MGQDVEDGRLVGGRYRLEGVLGRGGMGTVWRGRDETLGRTVAVKELRFPSSVDEEEKQRLITRTLREAKAIARIRSGSAITVFDVVDEDHRPWIVMELIEGGSLADRIREDGPLEPRRVAEVGLSILEVLRAAHREGILHRDVKPSNVLLEEGTGRVVLTDFGIAKVEGDPSITSTGMLVGAPSYISPERARGNPPGPPADLWSLGGLLYAAVEGRPPYDKGSAISTLTAVMTEPVPPLERAGALSEAILGLLEKDPEKRLDADGAQVLLEMALSSEGTATADPSGDMDATRVVPMPAAGPAPAAGASGAGPASGFGAGTMPGSGERAGGARPSASAASSAASAGPAGFGRASRASRASRSSASSGSPGSSGSSGPGTKPALGDLLSGRKLAVIAAIIALLVILGVVLANAGSGDDDKAEGSQGQSEGKQGSDGKGTEDAADGKEPNGSADDPKDDKPADDKPADDGGDGKDEANGDDGKGEDKPKPGQGSLPKGYKQVTDDRFHFSVAMPENFTRVGIAGANSGGKYGVSGGSYPRVQIDFNSSPTSDAKAAWEGLEPAVKGSSPGYRKLFIKELKWRDYPTTADWGFHRNESNRQVRVLNRGFKVDGGRGYAIMITCKAGTWEDDACRTLRETAFRTFQPK